MEKGGDAGEGFPDQQKRIEYRVVGGVRVMSWRGREVEANRGSTRRG